MASYPAFISAPNSQLTTAYMLEAIQRLDLKAEFYTEERCFINELSNSAADAEVSIARARVQPCVTTRWHRVLGTTERYVILEGTGLVEIGHLPPTIVNPGDVVIIPPDCAQRITNIGAEDLIFLAICSPRFRQEVYQDIEDTHASYIHIPLSVE